MGGTREPRESDREFIAMIDALRVAQDTITGARAPEDVVRKVRENLEEVSRLLEPFTVPEWEQVTGHLKVPGRGQTFSPAFDVDEQDEQHVRGRVSFGRYYLGGNGAVHGGALPLFFDEVLGRLANTGGRGQSRTAYLHVNFRKITPVGPELRFEGKFDREEGRKRYLTGTLHDPVGDLTADAEGLFVALLPGQP